MSRFQQQSKVVLAAIIAVSTASLGLAATLPPARDDAQTTVAPQADKVPVSMRLISAAQYENAIRQVFGLAFDARRFAPVRRNDGLVTVGSSTAVVTAGAFDLFDVASREVAAMVVAPENRAALIACRPVNAAQPDDQCARAFLQTVTRGLLRRSLSAAEMDLYVDIARRSAVVTKDFYRGLELVLSAVLIDPEFLYFTDYAEPDPEQPGEYRLDGRSLATRLSLLVWNAPPDEMLLKAAESGELQTADGLNRQLDRLLASPKMQNGVRAFFQDMLILEKLDTIAKDPTIYPAYTLKVASDAREQALRMVVDHLVVRNEGYPSLFTSRRTFLTQDLGVLYNIPVRASGRNDWVPYEFPEGDPRAGFLTQIAFLSANSHPGRTSPTLRGRALREVFMCQKVPDPPANVDFSIVEDPNAKLDTARDRLAMHNSEPNCAGCHKITDPVGLALEKFDGAGQFRLKEGHADIDTTGELDGKKYDDALGLAATVAQNTAVSSCVVRRLYQYGVARPAGKNDRPALTALEKQFKADDYKFDALLKAVATTERFRRVEASAVEAVLASRRGDSAADGVPTVRLEK